MATYGRVSEFDLESGSWDEYVEIFTAPDLEANDITDDDKKRAILLSMIVLV